MKADTISSAEWRWVAIFSGFLVTITLLPYAWALAVSDSQYQFMGILSNPEDGATYLSKIQQGIDGAWLFELRHTPQAHDPAGFHLFYLMLGHVASLLGLSPIVIFHLARVATTVFMYFALYQLGATIWTRLRPRRLFFMLISVSSGLGWLGLIFNQNQFAPDLIVPEAYPFFAAFTNPHFPLAIGGMALVAAQMMVVFRPGFTDPPMPENGAVLMVVLSVVLAIISPPAMLILGGVLTTYTLVRALKTRQIPFHEARWTSIIVLPAFPFAAYFYAVFRFNPIFHEFNEQNITLAPNIILFLLGYGVLFLVAIPALWRAFRRFESDGDQLMLVWVVVNSLAIYFPFFALQRRLFIGLIIPITYFAVRALEDHWVKRIPEQWRAPALIAVAVFILPTHFLTIAAPLAFSVMDREAGAATSLLLAQDYTDAFTWLTENGQRDEVILAATSVSLWIPARTPQRPVYGHAFETVPAAERLAQVQAFYRGEDCEALFNPALPFKVKYVIWGKQEDNEGLLEADDENIESILMQLGVQSVEEVKNVRWPTADNCRIWINEQAAETHTFDDVTVYILP